jgi:hypothetical protein
MSLHVIPLNDLKEHEECSTCECKPTLEKIDGEMMFVHNSYDSREKYEIQEKPELN